MGFGTLPHGAPPRRGGGEHQGYQTPAPSGATGAAKAEPNRRIAAAYLANGYTLAEIARHLGLHDGTVSKVVRAAERTENWQSKT